MGNVYAETGELKQALETFEQALPLRRKTGDVAGEATTLTNIGQIYSQTGEPRKALEYCQKALPLYRQVGDVAGEATGLTIAGTIYSSTGEPRKALFAAGSPTQVVAQWKVQDDTTAALMGRFYRELAAGKGKGAALREAMLAVLRDGQRQHPFYWAPFVLVGDWR